MEIFKKFLKLSRLKQIAIGVFLAHLLAVFSLSCHHIITKLMKSQKPIIVRTFAPQQQSTPKIAAAANPNKIAKTTSPKKTTHTQPESGPKPKQKKTTSPAPPKNKTKTTPQHDTDPILKEIVESLDILSDKPTQLKHSKLSLPSKVKAHAQIEPESKDNPSYGEFLVAFLQESLDLPEHGEVKAKIEIDHFGHLISCEWIEVKSSKNREFLKNKLPELTFPSFSDFNITELTQSYTITFRNRN